MTSKIVFFFLFVLIGQNFPQYLVKLNSSANQAAIAQRGTSEIYSIGDGHLYKSTDAGTTWTYSSAPASMSCLYPFGTKNIYAANTDIIYISRDDGYSWTVRGNLGNTSKKGVYFVNEKKVFVFGTSTGSSNGAISVSNDSGASFTAVTLPTVKYINSMFFLNEQTGFCGTQTGQFLRTTDGGTTWTLTSTGVASIIQKIYFADNLNGWAAGSAGYIFKTIDGGVTWTNTVYSSQPTWSGMKFFDAQNGILSGDTFILRTTNGGTDWTAVPGSATYIFRAVLFTSINSGWLTGLRIYKFDMTTPGVAITNPGPNLQWSAGSANAVEWNKSLVQGTVSIYLSTNGGDSWNLAAGPVANDTNSATVIAPFLNSNSCYLKAVVNTSPTVTGYSANYFKISVNPSTTATTPNQISQYLINNGITSYYNAEAGYSGLNWPAGTYKTAIYIDGVLWSGKVNGDLRMGGSTYRSAMQPGNVASGAAADPTLAEFNIWKIRKDWQQSPAGIERDRYAYNVLNWPVNIGAPYDDVNHDGNYTPGVDAPKFIGDETCWYVANDFDSSSTTFFEGTQPIGVEMQVTVFGFNNAALKDVIFKKTKLINKGSNTVTDMYFSIWSDPDLGDAEDDYVGCDTLLNLGYVYNADNDDGGGVGATYGTPPPAAGYQVVQGPIVPGTSADSAFSEGRFIKGKRNIPMNSFTPYTKDGVWPDPNLGTIAGAQQIYNSMQGRHAAAGDVILDPNTNLPTTFPLSGDPVAGIGWYEGAGWPNGRLPGDRRLMTSFGPFSFAPGDTQEIVYATLMAQGSSNLGSVTALKNLCQVVKGELQHVFTAVIDGAAVPTDFRLEQNYPNPFNPSTTISYSLPVESTVNIYIYNSLGQTVREVLNNTLQSSGNKKITLDANKLSSGVYFYSVSAKSLDGKREFRSVKKMIVLR